MVIEQPYTLASHGARRIAQGKSGAMAEWEADKCSKHFSYRLKGKAGTKRPVPMTSVKSLATRFYRLKYRHAPTGVYQKRFGHQEDDKCCCAEAEAGWRPRRGDTSSTTAASGETSKRHYGRRWERRWAGMQADADTCRSLSWFP